MGKKVLFAAFLLLGLFAPQAQAYDFIDTAQSGQTLRYTILSDSASVNVAKHGNITGDLVIPDSVTYNGTTYAVTTVKANGFGMCFGLTSVSIPSTVATIGGAAFQSCIGLTSITIPNSVTTIGDNAFTLCSGLTSVSIGNSVDTIGSAVFASCDNLITVTIPASVTYIGSGAFYCQSLDTIILLGQTPPNAHSAAFGSPTNNPYLCDSATLVVPCGAAGAYSADAVFGNFANIEEACADGIFSYTYQGTTLYYIIDSASHAVVVPPLYPNPHWNEDSTRVDAWWGYTQPQGWVVVPDSVPHDGNNHAVAAVGDRAFQHCTGITGFTLPATMRFVGAHGFDDIPLMTTLALPQGVTSIGLAAFQYCTRLQSITLPDALTSMGTYAFWGCSSLTSVNLPQGITEIPDYCFEGDSSLMSATIPSSVTILGENAFFDCSHLTEAILPEGLEQIKDGAFSGCRSLTSVVLPESLTYLGAWAFSECSGLTSISIPEGIDSIRYAAFAVCSALPSVSFPSTVTYIGDFAFNECASLSAVNFPQGADITIGYGCFLHDESLTAVDIPSNVKYIGDFAFSECSNLVSVTLHEGLEYLGEGAFASCPALPTIVIPEGIDTIRYVTLAECTSLRRVALPASLLHLGDSVFIVGTPLDTLMLGCAVPPSLGNGVFEHYNTVLIVPCGAAETYRSHPVWGLFANIEENCNGIEDVREKREDVRVYSTNGRIVVEGAYGETLQVYDLAGRQMLNVEIQNSKFKIQNSKWPSGLYLVKVGNRPAQKVVVKFEN